MTGKRHLLMRLEAPLMAFGTTLIDSLGPVQDFPATSLITGLIANALGWNRNEATKLQALQDRLVHAVRLDLEGERLRDYQTADLDSKDAGWTRSGKPEGRAGGAGTYKGQHQRQRWYQADASALVAFRLEPAEEEPSLDAVAEALNFPARPLFIGRKPCLPSTPLFAGWVEADDASQAIAFASPDEAAIDARTPDLAARVFWPQGEGPVTRDRRQMANCRNWRVDVHAGFDVWYGGTGYDLQGEPPALSVHPS
ncbi:type I-E CRISPR-associated protein Cas5/CasD [Aquidulcibacter paucihalophilus]|uniref:type I-E CRISPR-associated protein Cas5/CasD n=1 Tax=Aquidulcibacter paucihalophilus TaxID=1978549 RepID=UPI000A19023D|nr:type I-E CRISPR-associated protein Cas5/CasD [Aquidulcibacter paucihalophilus]